VVPGDGCHPLMAGAFHASSGYEQHDGDRDQSGSACESGPLQATPSVRRHQHLNARDVSRIALLPWARNRVVRDDASGTTAREGAVRSFCRNRPTNPWLRLKHLGQTKNRSRAATVIDTDPAPGPSTRQNWRAAGDRREVSCPAMKSEDDDGSWLVFALGHLLPRR
jgi:hypothetical protein